MKPIIVATSDLADGFRLAGITVFELETGEDGHLKMQIERMIEAIRKLPDAGIVLVDERYIEPFEKAFSEVELPMVASFPAEEVKREEAYIDELTKRFLGQKIYVEGEVM